MIVGKGVAFTEAVDCFLDGAQGLLPADGRFLAADLVAQAADTFGKTAHRRIPALGGGVAILDLIEQSDEFTAQGLPLTGGWIAAGRGRRVLIEIGAGHVWSLSS